MQHLQKTKARQVEITCNVHHTHIMNAGIFYNSKDPPCRIRIQGAGIQSCWTGQCEVWTDDFGISVDLKEV